MARAHGLGRYKHDGCRCEVCTEANAEAQRRYRGGKQFQPTDHGSRWCYVKGCRCDECVQANRDYQREYARLRRAGVATRDPWIEEALR